MSDQNWSGIKGIISYTQDEKPETGRSGDMWYKTNDYTNENKIEIKRVDSWGRFQKTRWGTGADYGYVCGGASALAELSFIDRIVFPFDSGTATHVGNLDDILRFSASNNSSTHGYTFGGATGPTTVYFVTSLYRFTFPFDSGTSTRIGNISSVGNDIRLGPSGFNSSIHGYSCGAWTGSASYTHIDRFTFPFDSGTASIVGNLGTLRRDMSGLNSSVHGYNCGGWDGASRLSNVDRIAFPFDSGTASNVGNLSISRLYSAGNNSSTHGYNFGGGDVAGGTLYISTVDKFIFPFDSGTASVVGSLSANKKQLPGNNSSNCGYVSGGHDGGVLSTIERVDFPFDIGNVRNVGNLSNAMYWSSATDGTDFVTQLI